MAKRTYVRSGGAGWSADKFVGNIVAICVAIVVFGLVAIPVIGIATSNMDAEADKNLITLINVIPIFLIIGILMATIYMFISKRQ